MKNDLFETIANATRPNLKGFEKAQSRYDNETPEEYNVVHAENQIDVHKSYKNAMELSIEYIRKEIILFKKAGRFDCATILEGEIDEIVCDLAKRESDLS